VIRVVVADDHALVRIGLVGILEAAGDFEIVGEASDGAEAVGICRRVRPDVVLMDLVMTPMGGLEATKLLVALQPDIKVVALTSSSDRKDVLEIIEAGAVGYLLKNGNAANVVQAVRTAVEGGHPIDWSITRHVLTARPERATPEVSERERAVIELVARGKSNAEIAGDLGISVKTVKAHLTRIYPRLGIRSRSDVAAWVSRHLVTD
jgi:DNA-binding NarL/FixJ family response regulator